MEASQDEHQLSNDRVRMMARNRGSSSEYQGLV